jgi:LAO/AO transport system kinase
MRILGAAKHLFQRKFDERADEIGAHVQAVVDRDMDPSGAAYLLLGWTDEVQAT